MKKNILLIAGVMLLSQVTFSQSKFRFGLKVAPSINWLKPDVVKDFTNGGSTIGFNWGLKGEYAITERFSFYSGLELNHERGKIKFEKDNYYFMKPGYELVKTEEIGGVQVAEDARAYRLKISERTYKSTYVTLPVGVKMKTNEIGYMTYFGEFGLNFGFRTATKINDKAALDDIRAIASESASYNDLESVNYDKDMQPIRVQLRVGLGGEYKISEGTSLFGAVHYNLGFTNVVKGNSRYLINDANKALTQKFSAHGLQLSVGVLF